ncbi:MAG: TIGR02147 family protein [bacterium]
MEPSIYKYLDYRQFLRDMVAYKRSASPVFSLEMLGRRTGCLTKSHISLILSGRRGLTSRRAAALGQALGLVDKELSYYQQLVQFNQAKDDTQREQHLSVMMSHMGRRSGSNLSMDSYRALENWHCLALRELARRPNFDPNPAAISARLKNLLTQTDARRAIKLLIDTRMLVENENGQLVPSMDTARSTDEINSLAIRKYHKSCLDLGKKVIEQEPVEAREFGSINLLLKKEDQPKLKEMIKDFRERILSLAAKDDLTSAKVTQVNIQMFHLSE